MNAANILTLSRLCATPFVVWLMYGASPASRYSALGLFIAAMLTDCFDGPLARRFGRTVLGNYLDPVADKTLILCVFVAVAERCMLPLWMALVTISRELIVSGVRDVAAAHGRVVGANWMGKTKTFLQVVTLSAALLLLAYGSHAVPAAGSHPSAAEQLLWGLAFGTVALSVAFAVVFLYWNRRTLMAGSGGAAEAGHDTIRANQSDEENHTMGEGP